MAGARELVRELERISSRIAAAPDLELTLEDIVEVLSDTLGARRCSILLKTSTECMRIRAARHGAPNRDLT